MINHHKTIRACLAAAPDGMSIADLVACTGILKATVRNSLKTCYGVYIDRYEGPFRGQWRAIYMVVHVPEDAPVPEKKAKD